MPRLDLHRIKHQVSIIRACPENSLLHWKCKAMLFEELLEQIKYLCDSHGIEEAIDEVLKATVRQPNVPKSILDLP